MLRELEAVVENRHTVLVRAAARTAALRARINQSYEQDELELQQLRLDAKKRELKLKTALAASEAEEKVLSDYIQPQEA